MTTTRVDDEDLLLEQVTDPGRKPSGNAALGAAATIATQREHGATATKRRAIFSEDTRMFASPSLDKLVFQAPDECEVEMIEYVVQEGGKPRWKIRRGDHVGWVHCDYLLEIHFTPGRRAIFDGDGTEDGQHLRSTPNFANSTVVYRVPESSEVTMLGYVDQHGGRRYQVRHKGYTGWTMLACLSEIKQ